MNRFKYKLQSFMMGRYGIDDFYYFLLICYTVLLLINCFLRSASISIALWLILGYTLFRILSKNISARQKENAKYLILKNRTIKSFKRTKERFRDKEHVYRKCPHCKATLRFPRKKGKHDAVCPKCRKNLKVRILF